MEFMRAEIVLDVNHRQLAMDLTKAERLVTRAAKAMEHTFQRLARVMTKAFRTMTKAAKYVVAAILAIGAAATKMAMDAEESENLFTESMGKMANAARAWSIELSDAMHMNEYEIRKNVGTFNVMLESMGHGTEEAYKMATGLTKLSYDMASFYNLKPDEAFQKIRSGIVGMSRPLKDLGILLDETTVKQYALNAGIFDGVGDMTQIQKVQARYGALLEQTTKAQGDMARTLDSTTNVFRSIWGVVQELAIEIGKNLLPAVTKAGIAMRDWIVKNKQNIIDWSKVIIDKIDAVIEKLNDLWAVFKTGGFSEGLQTILKSLDPVFHALVDSFLITGIAAGKALWAGIRSATPSQRFITERRRSELEQGAPLVWGVGDRDRIIGDLQQEAIASQIKLTERLAEAWKGVGTAMADAIPERRGLTGRGIWLRNLEMEAKGLEMIQSHAGDLYRNPQQAKPDAPVEIPFVWVPAAEQEGRMTDEMYAYEMAAAERWNDYQIESARKVTDAQIEFARDSIDQIRSLHLLSHTEKLAHLNELMERKREDWGAESEAMAILAEERQRYTEQQIEGWNAVSRAMDVWFDDAVNWGKKLGDVMTQTFDRMADSFADMLMKQKVDWKAFGAMFIKELLSMIMKLYIAVALKAALQGWGGLTQSVGQTGSGPAAYTPTPGVVESLGTGYAGGGHVLETGIAKVHKGEDIVPAGSGLTVNVLGAAEAGVSVDVEDDPDQRTYNIVLSAIGTDGPMRRAIAGVRK